MRRFVPVSAQNRIATLALSLAVSACLCIPLPEARA